MGLTAGLRRYLYLTAACSGAAVLIVEILGAKMLAPYLGTSHFVWTAQMAVTLVALATGYALGGWMADRWPTLRWMYGLLLAAAAWLCGAALICEPVAFACLRLRLATGSLLAAAALFFVPLTLLGMIGPVFVRALTRSLASVGQSVGRLTAISTIGSVVGTILIGYVLIPFLPNSTTLCATAGALVVVSVVYFLVWDRRQIAGIGIGVAGCGLLVYLGATQKPFASVPGLVEIHRRNSNFGLMQVVENRSGTRRYYLNDLLTQNSYDPQSRQSAALFTHMLYGLSRAYATNATNFLCIGLGVGVVPMQLVQDGAQVEVVEINPAVVPLAERFFDFEPNAVRIHVGDGRFFLQTATNRYDVVVLDAFLGESPPSHLMTRESFASVRRCLKPDGLLVMNTFGDFDGGRDFLLASIEQTLGSVFPSTRIHAASDGNVFFVASPQAGLEVLRTPDFSLLPPELRRQAEQTFATIRVTNPAHGIILTDNFNPADYRDAVNREDLRRRLAMGYQPDAG